MKNFIVLLSLAIFINLGCNATKQTAEDSSVKTIGNNIIKNPDVNLTLTDHLRRIPGIRISGNGRNANVTVRGTCPLFVVNGHRLSGGLSEVSTMTPIQDIKSIRLLNVAEANLLYRGLDGPKGVIEIKTK